MASIPTPDMARLSAAIEALDGATDPRVVGLAASAQQLADAETEAAQASDLTKLARATSSAIRANGPLSLADREKLARATRDAQEKYLAQMSPAGAAAWRGVDDAAETA
jgi:hypothetical protein